MKKDILKVVLIGDGGVGKVSIHESPITSLIMPLCSYHRLVYEIR